MYKHEKVCIILILLVCLLIFSIPVKAQDLVKRSKVIELAEKFILNNQGEMTYLQGARIGEPQLLKDKQSHPSKWRVEIINNGRRVGHFYVKAHWMEDGGLPVWFSGPGNGKKVTSDNPAMSRVPKKRTDQKGISGTGAEIKHKREARKQQQLKYNTDPKKVVPKGSSEPIMGPSSLIFDPSKLKRVIPEADEKVIPKKKAPQPESPTGWQTIKEEDFEGSFPNDWDIFVSSGYADAYWDDTSYKKYQGSWGGFCADAGSDGTGWGGQYVNDMMAWMIYGPFSLADATDAYVDFWHWTKTETSYDKFYYVASTNGTNFYGWYLTGDLTGETGNVNGWLNQIFDLTSVYSIGDLTGESQVWIAFVFSSNASSIDDGTYLDEIYLKKNTGGGEPTLNDHFTCRDGDDPYNTQTTTFYTTDYLATEYTVWNTSSCTRDWTGNKSFYDQNNDYYAGLDFTITQGYTSWYYWIGIYIAGFYPENNPGTWNVRVSLEGSELARDYFDIIEEYGDPDIRITPTNLDIYQTVRNTGKPSPPPEDDEAPLINGRHATGLIVPDYVKEYWQTHTVDLQYDVNAFASSVDWSGNDSPVKNQMNCGSCWAFAAIGLIENLGGYSDLSEQVIVSCAPGDCNGGWYWDALEYVHNDGVPPEACYPYIAQNGNCNDKCNNPAYTVKVTQYTPAWGLWGEPANVNDIKSQLQNGPICVAMLVPTDGTFDWYSGGVYNYNGGPISWDNGHAVLLVGYNDNGQYFKAKNSWGASWGENGYFRISYDDVTDDVHFGMYGCDASGVYQEGSAGETFLIENVGTADLIINYMNSNKGWLAFSPSSVPTLPPGGSQVVTVNVTNWNDVNCPQETGEILINSNDPDEQNRRVYVTAHCQENPILVVNPNSLTFSANYGTNPPAQTFQISNGGAGSFNWNVTDDQSWLSTSPTSGSCSTETDVVTVSINTSGLSQGTHQGTITVTAPGADNSPQFVNVTLNYGEIPCDPPYIKPSDASGGPGSNVTIDVNIEQNPNPIDAFGFQFTYNNNRLSLVSVEKGDLDVGFSFFQANENPPGVVTIGGFDTTPIPANSSGSIARVTLHVDQCSEGETLPFGVQDLTDDLVGLNTCEGTFTCQSCLLGDVNMDDAVSPGDALCAFQIYLNGGTPPAGECNNECALYAADVNCNPNGVTPGDALYIFQAYLNGETPPLDCDPSFANEADDGSNRQLAIVQLPAQQADEVRVALHITNPQGMKAFGVELGFPEDILSLTGVTTTQLTECWEAFDGQESVAGVVTIGGFNPEAVAANQSGALAIITFRVNSGADRDAEMWLYNLCDDVAGANIPVESFRIPITMTDVRKINQDNIPDSYSLEQNYPNPFNMETEIVYQLPEPGFVTLEIYNSMGQKVKTLVSQKQEAGRYRAHWDGKDAVGSDLPSGIYLYKLSTSKFVDARKLILIK